MKKNLSALLEIIKRKLEPRWRMQSAFPAIENSFINKMKTTRRRRWQGQGGGEGEGTQHAREKPLRAVLSRASAAECMRAERRPPGIPIRRCAASFGCTRDFSEPFAEMSRAPLGPRESTRSAKIEEKN